MSELREAAQRLRDYYGYDGGRNFDSDDFELTDELLDYRDGRMCIDLDVIARDYLATTARDELFAQKFDAIKSTVDTLGIKGTTKLDKLLKPLAASKDTGDKIVAQLARYSFVLACHELTALPTPGETT